MHCSITIEWLLHCIYLMPLRQIWSYLQYKLHTYSYGHELLDRGSLSIVSCLRAFWHAVKMWTTNPTRLLIWEKATLNAELLPHQPCKKKREAELGEGVEPGSMMEKKKFKSRRMWGGVFWKLLIEAWQKLKTISGKHLQLFVSCNRWTIIMPHSKCLELFLSTEVVHKL